MNARPRLRNSPTGRRSRLRRPRRRSDKQRGQSLVEVALIFPIALVLLAGAVDMGRLFFARVSIENAAREGAVFAANNPRCDTAARDSDRCDGTNSADWRARNEAGAGLDGLVTTFTCFSGGIARASVEDCMTGDMYEVVVQDQFDFIMPLLAPIFGGSLTLEAAATSRVMNTATDPSTTPVTWPTPEPPQCIVPDLVGDGTITRDDAELLWSDAEFTGDFNYDRATFKKQDIVGDQDLTADTEIECASDVTVTEA